MRELKIKSTTAYSYLTEKLTIYDFESLKLSFSAVILRTVTDTEFIAS